MTSEHAALRDSVRGLVTAHGGDDGLWARLCREIGVAGLTVPERYGGSGAGLTEAMIVLEELGRALIAGPMLGTVLATEALLHAGDDTLLPAVCAGDRIVALAWDSPAPGVFRDVLDLPEADTLLVVTGGNLYEANPSTVTMQPTLDPTRHPASLSVDSLRLIGPGVPVERLRDVACLALAAEQVGAAERALELTVDHVKSRYQFGRPIGSFQVLQHRLAELYVRVEAARSACAVSPAVAKITCSETLRAVAADMVQMHGGLAITWEHHAHLYLRRAWASAELFGSPAHHLARLTATHGSAPVA
ncbi:acyl-CoA dehydrogenase family protein [Actinoplanes utahensis]|uniref:Acyl-CoA dehydrogenase n=1 Tax=Actinoplanes utahensis TaxID=1869 RepID=A0A0A6UQ09_ACTUT|nr:acyl-CoA dehydrogenase family protein [Actinoplanes utahensis]KHD76444.1 hypothetical protein MB27_17200 [Actinoplanes utahensis]GIF29772.1 acyl-CoA dehydrogenase [Actinoplanes utahensis]